MRRGMNNLAIAGADIIRPKPGSSFMYVNSESFIMPGKAGG